MKKLLYILILWVVSSCAEDTVRAETDGYVYFDDKPVENAEILTWQGYSKGFVIETITNKDGYFQLNKITEYHLGLESRELSQEFIIIKNGLKSDTLKTYSSRVPNIEIIPDTIFLKNKEK